MLRGADLPVIVSFYRSNECAIELMQILRINPILKGRLFILLVHLIVLKPTILRCHSS